MPELMQTIFELPQDAISVRLLKRVEKASISIADSVITVNQACRKLFASRSCSQEKITVVMNSPDERIFNFTPVVQLESSEKGAKPFTVMYHGSLVERNGLGLAVEAFSRALPQIPTAELRVYGSRNAFLDKVMERVRELGIEDSVHYMGSRPLEEIVKAIQHCDVGLIPNEKSIFTELNTPTRIFEYLAMGKPVIAPKAPGITDYFEDDSLVFFDLGNAEDLADKLRFVYDNPPTVHQMTARAQKVHLGHTWCAEKLQLTQCIARLLMKGKSGNSVQSRHAEHLG